MKQKLNKLKRPAKIGFHGYLGDTQGCGTIRAIYPGFLLNHVREQGLQCIATYLMNYITDVDWYKPFTFVTFQRSATAGHLDLIKHFKNTVQKKYPIPCIYEIDDMLFNIPEWNYASLYYNQAEEVVKNIMRECDAMVTSTAKLREVYSPYNNNITVIPNHLPKFIWGEIYPAHEYYEEGNKIKILWGGSQNHFAVKQITGDKIKGGDFGNDLIDFIKKTTDKYDWHFMGALPEELQEIKDKIKFHPWKSVFEYPHALKDIEPDICLAPLNDVEFNHCKSNIKALEYTACGAVGIYSDVTPYKFMNTKAKSDEEFIYHIERLANDIDLRAKVFKKDYQRVKGQLWWEENNNIKRYINSYLGLFGQTL